MAPIQKRQSRWSTAAPVPESTGSHHNDVDEETEETLIYRKFQGERRAAAKDDDDQNVSEGQCGFKKRWKSICLGCWQRRHLLFVSDVNWFRKVYVTIQAGIRQTSAGSYRSLEQDKTKVRRENGYRHGTYLSCFPS